MINVICVHTAMALQSGNYNLPLYMIAVMLIVSAVLFAFINPEKPIIKS